MDTTSFGYDSADILTHLLSPFFKQTQCRNVQLLAGDCAPCVAVVREEGSNGDREMAAAFHMAGFRVWDVNMQDLCIGQIDLERFRGVAFVGGFSYADVCGSAKGQDRKL